MTFQEKQKIKKWIKSWERTSSALKEIKKNELLSYDYSKNWHIVDEMLQWAYINREPRIYSGLVDQQRLFNKLRESNKKT